MIRFANWICQIDSYSIRCDFTLDFPKRISAPGRRSCIRGRSCLRSDAKCVNSWNSEILMLKTKRIKAVTCFDSEKAEQLRIDSAEATKRCASCWKWRKPRSLCSSSSSPNEEMLLYSCDPPPTDARQTGEHTKLTTASAKHTLHVHWTVEIQAHA